MFIKKYIYIKMKKKKSINNIIAYLKIKNINSKEFLKSWYDVFILILLESINVCILTKLQC